MAFKYFDCFAPHQTASFVGFFSPEGPFPTASLGINAFSFIRIANTTPGALSQTVPSLMSTAEARPLLRPSQVLSLPASHHRALISDDFFFFYQSVSLRV